MGGGPVRSSWIFFSIFLFPFSSWPIALASMLGQEIVQPRLNWQANNLKNWENVFQVFI